MEDNTMEDRMNQEINSINELDTIGTKEPYITYSYDSGSDKRKSSRKKHNKTGKKVGAIILSGVLLGSVAGGAFQLTNYIGNTFFDTKGVEAKENSGVDTIDSSTHSNYEAQKVSSVNTSTESTNSVTQVAEAVMPSIVSITNQSVEEVQSMFRHGQTETYKSESSGSGIIIGENDTELLIVTNNHVVAGADTLTVCFTDDSVVEAKIKGTDSTNDLAVIAVELANVSEETLNKIAVAALGSSDDLAIGEQVVAIGNALGYGQSVTTGIVSALNREIAADDMTSNTYVQTDAAINSGNSGGALVNMKGEVIGINTAKIAGDGVEGMGFAIPMSSAESIISGLMEQTTKEKVSEENKGSLGISGADVTSEVSEVYGMPEGVYVNAITGGSAAEEAGLQTGDIITHIDGSQITDISNLQSQLAYYAAGDKVTLTIQRKVDTSEYTEQTIEVTLMSAVETNQGQSSSYDGMQIGGFGY